LTATVLLGTILLLYALIQFWPPSPPAATTGAALTTSTSTATTAASEAASGTTGQAAVEPAVQFFAATVNLSREGRLFVIVLLAGSLGGMVRTLRSLYWYVGNRNLRYSWLLMYATLPITGTALATALRATGTADRAAAGTDEPRSGSPVRPAGGQKGAG
jgi:hypothetical protein